MKFARDDHTHSIKILSAGKYPHPSANRRLPHKHCIVSITAFPTQLQRPFLYLSNSNSIGNDMSFDIILPTYNNLYELKSCLDGLAHQTYTSFKAIICIDGSSDGTAEYLSEARYPFRFIVADHTDRRNHGRNATRNLALPYLESDYLLLLDSDAVPAPDLIESHLAPLAKQECVSVGTINYTNTDTNIWARYIATRGRYRLQPGKQILYHRFNSGNAAFPTRYFKELGGQDPAMTHYGGGDTEFAIRLFDRYHLPFFNNMDAAASSLMNKELTTALEQMVELGRYNLRYIYNKHPAHRNLYGMSSMKRYPVLFAIAGSKLLMRFASSMVHHVPARLQIAFVRYLVIANVYQGFSSK
jgi:glycosyltransferase involved in cell wall biosynthesis